MLTPSDPRQQRGLEIAATANIVRKGGAWLVPSQSGKGRYTVCPDPTNPIALARTTRTAGRQVQAHLRGRIRHLNANTMRDGSTTVTEMLTVQ